MADVEDGAGEKPETDGGPSMGLPNLSVKGGDALSGARSVGGSSDGQMFSPFVVNQGGGLWWAVAAITLGYFLWKKRG